MNATTSKPLPHGTGIVNACPHCFAALDYDDATDGPDALGVCPDCGEAFTHQRHRNGRICARMPRAWFLQCVSEETRAELRRIQEGVWHGLGQWG